MKKNIFSVHPHDAHVLQLSSFALYSYVCLSCKVKCLPDIDNTLSLSAKPFNCGMECSIIVDGPPFVHHPPTCHWNGPLRCSGKLICSLVHLQRLLVCHIIFRVVYDHETSQALQSTQSFIYRTYFSHVHPYSKPEWLCLAVQSQNC